MAPSPQHDRRDPVTGVETMGHEWDGIAELNNPLPTWWVQLFWVTAAVSVVMWVLLPSWPYGTGYFPGLLGSDQRRDVVAAVDAAKLAQAGMRGRIADSEVAAILADPDLLSFALEGGRVAFADNCQPCHGQGGAGQSGRFPALVDDDWLWGGSPEAILQTIRFGIRADHPMSRAGEMPAFGDVLTQEQIDEVATYTASLPGGAALAPAPGATLFAENCAGCHGEDGGGNQELGAPRLNDRTWLYGGEPAAIAGQIRQPRHGMMPAWSERLPPETVKMLAAYVHSLGGGESAPPASPAGPGG